MEKIKIGVVGVGRLVSVHAGNVAHGIPNTQLVAVCDVCFDVAKKVGAELGVPAFADEKEMYDAVEMEAVLISNSPGAHAESIKEACARKLHIFCEKPVGINPQDLAEVREVVKTNADKVIQIGFMRRFDNSYMEAKKKILAGEIGKVIKVRSVSRDPSCQKEIFIKLGPTLAGMFFDLSVHDFDVVRWIADSEPESIYSIGGVYEFEEFKEFGDIDNCSVLIKFKNGVMAEVEGSKNASCGYDVWMEVVGTKGTLLVTTQSTSNVVQKDEHGMRNICEPWFFERFEQAYKTQIEVFANTIQSGGESEMSTEDACIAAEMAEMAQESYRQGKVIRV